MDEGCHRALVVEDDEDTRDVLTMLLTVLGFEVEQAENGRSALERIRGGWKPDVIVLDLLMPVMNGWAFRSELRRIPEAKDVPVIVLSGRQPPFRDHDDEMQVAEMLPKPFEINTFLAAVSRHCPTLAANAPSWLAPAGVGAR